MLSLSAPFSEYEGVVVGGDYSNPRQFWYFPNRPRLALDEAGRPVARLIVYRNLDDAQTADDTVTSFFVFDTVVSWPQATLEKVAQHLKQDLGLHDDPILSPLLYRSGRTRCTFLDRVKPAAPPHAGDPEPPEDWVTFIDAPATPALFGENRASFTVQLTKKATTLLYASLDGFIPAGIVYELDYPAMQRAFAVRVEADWKIVYQRIRDFEGQRLLFWSHEVEKIVEHLETDQVVKFTSAIEGVDEEGMPSEFAEARKALQQFVFEKFFAVVPDPKAAGEPSVPDQILSFLGALRSTGLHVDFSCVKRTLDVDQLRELHAEWTVDRAVLRTIAPQAHLGVFWGDFAPPLTRDDLVSVVDGDDGLWRTVDLDIIANADFGADAVAEVVVDVAYGDFVAGLPAPGARRFDVVLDAGHPRATVRDWYSPAAGTTLHYQYRVVFGPDAVVGQGVVLTSPWIECAAGAIVVSPAQLYREQRTTFVRAKILDGAVFPQVLAHLRYTDPVTAWTYQTSGLLEAGGSPWTPVLRARADAPPRSEYRLEYPMPGGSIATDWQESTSDLVLVEDPRTNLFTVNVLVGDRSALGQIVVSLAYDDAQANTHLATAMVISKDTVDQPHTWTFPRAHVDRDVYRVSQLMIGNDNTVVQTPWVQCRDAVLVVGPLFARKWNVQVALVGPRPQEAGISSVTVSLSYDDPSSQVHAAQVLTFTDIGKPQVWPLALADPQARTYRYTVRYEQPNGFVHLVGPSTASDTFLLIPSSPATP